eukprot:TCONS_00055489-protein
MSFHNAISGTPGIILIVVISFVLILLICAALYLLKNKKPKNVRQSIFDHEKQIKYGILDYPQSGTPEFHPNPIQPPYQTKVKVKLIPNNAKTKTSIKYTELGEGVEEAQEDHKILDDLSSGEHSPNQKDFRRSVHLYKDKITNFISKYRDDHDLSSLPQNDTERRIWQPEPVAVNQTHRLQRPDSVLSNEQEMSLGRLTFTMYYLPGDEYLTLLLISGRQLNSCDSLYNIRLPAVSIVIENNPNTEVTSNPDEAPNPEYDQEFTFTIRSKELFDVVLRFTVWDIISNNETRVLGFFRVPLAQYQKTLLAGSDTGPICREIQPCLNPPSMVLGQLLISLLYDCVTDKIFVTVRQFHQLSVSKDDLDMYLKVSLLLDNDIIVSKRSKTFTSTRDLHLTQTFEFSALSDELDKMSTETSPILKVADELITNASSNYKKSLVIKDVRSVRETFASDTLKNHMGVLISVRATTGTTRNKRVIGRLYLGKTNFPFNDEEFHWVEMKFDATLALKFR